MKNILLVVATIGLFSFHAISINAMDDMLFWSDVYFAIEREQGKIHVSPSKPLKTYLDKLEWDVKNGANPNVVFSLQKKAPSYIPMQAIGNTPLEYAVLSGAPKTASALIKLGADVNIEQLHKKQLLSLFSKNPTLADDMIIALITTISPKDIESILPAFRALQQKLGATDLSNNEEAQNLIRSIVTKKMNLLGRYLQIKTFVEKEDLLQKEIETNIFNALQK